MFFNVFMRIYMHGDDSTNALERRSHNPKSLVLYEIETSLFNAAST
jgi:hypothetical protein